MNFFPLPLIHKNLVGDLGEIMPGVLSGQPDINNFGHVSLMYRRIAAAELLLSGATDGFIDKLQRSVQAYNYYLDATPPEDQATSKATVFFDAVAAGDHRAAELLAQKCSRNHNPQREYEEDFLYIRILMDLFALGYPDEEIHPMLEEYEGYLAGEEDPKFKLLKGFVDADQELFDEALGEALHQIQDEFAEQRAAETLSPVDDATIVKVSTEIISWLWFAEKRGLVVPQHVWAVPDLVRNLPQPQPAPDNVWRTPKA